MKKKILKAILEKLPVFIFCVLFINGYNYLCGSENSIVGVILLMSLLMFLGSNFEINPKIASISIPIVLTAIGVGAKVSLINPFIGLGVNIIIIFGIVILTSQDTAHSCFLPFLMGYIMFQGYDVSGELYKKRILSLMIVGVFVGIIYYIKNRKNTYHLLQKNILKGIYIKNSKIQWGVKLTITLVVTMFINSFINYPKGMWIYLTILSLFAPLNAEDKSRHKSRIPATILGSIVFFELFEHIVPEDKQMLIVLLAGFCSMFITSYFIKTIYNSFSALVTAVLAFPAHTAIFLRISGNIIGVVIVLLSKLFFDFLFKRIERSQDSSIETTC